MVSKKNVPELRFPEFSGGFKEYSIDDLVKVVDCLHSTAPISFEHTSYKMIRTGNVRNGNLIISTMDSVEKEVYEKWSSKGYLEPKDIILTREAPMGEVAIIPPNSKYKFFLGQRCLQLKVRDNFIDSEYMYLLLQGKRFEKYIRPLKFSGSTVSNIRIPELKNFKFLIPDLDEQVKVKEILLNLNRLIELEEKKLELLEEQKKGYMQKIFSQELKFKDENGNDYPEWEEKRLLDLAKVKTGNMNVQDSDEKGLYEFFDRSQHIKYLNTFTFDEEAIIYPGEGSEFLPKYFKGKYSLHQRAYSIFNINCNPIFLYYILQTKGNHFLKFAVGSTVKSLRMSSFDKLSLTIPTIEEQGKIERLLSKLERRIEVSRENCNELLNMKKGLLEKMFI